MKEGEKECESTNCHNERKEDRKSTGGFCHVPLQAPSQAVNPERAAHVGILVRRHHPKGGHDGLRKDRPNRKKKKRGKEKTEKLEFISTCMAVKKNTVRSFEGDRNKKRGKSWTQEISNQRRWRSRERVGAEKQLPYAR